MSDRLRTVDVVAAGTLSTVGAGLFVGLAPGASLAGAWLPAALVLAAVLAGLSTVERKENRRTRVAAVADGAGLLGQVAAAAALGGAVGAYVSPLMAPLVVMGVTAFTVTGLRLPAVVTRVAAIAVLAVLAVVAVACFTIAPEPTTGSATDPVGVVAAAVILFVGFTGAGRPRLLVVLGVVLAVSLAVAIGALRQLGAPRLALSPVPLRDALAAADATPVGGLLTVGVLVACAFALLGALRKVRTVLAARTRHALPGTAVAGALAAAGAVLVDPVTALVVAAVLLLVEPVIRVVGHGRRQAQ